MPTFIKTGFWEKVVTGYKGWLNLDDLIRSIISSTPTTDAAVSFPTVQDNIQYINNTTLGSFSVTYLPIYSSEIIFPNATTATIIEFGGDNKLDYTTRLSFPNLVSVTNRIYVYGGNNGSALTSFEVPSLTTCGYLEITNCPDLVTLDLSSLTTAPEFAISYNSSLTTIDLSGLTTINSTTNYSFQYNALNEATVNAILVKFADIQPTGTGEIYLDGGTSAAPTGAGATAKTTLESGGWTVFTN